MIVRRRRRRRRRRKRWRILKMMLAILANFHLSANKLLENFMRRPQSFSQGQICLSLGVNRSHMVKGGENVLGLNWGYLTWWEGKLEHKSRDRCRIRSRAEFRAPEIGPRMSRICYKRLTRADRLQELDIFDICAWFLTPVLLEAPTFPPVSLH